MNQYFQQSSSNEYQYPQQQSGGQLNQQQAYFQQPAFASQYGQQQYYTQTAGQENLAMYQTQQQVNLPPIQFPNHGHEQPNQNIGYQSQAQQTGQPNFLQTQHKQMTTFLQTQQHKQDEIRINELTDEIFYLNTLQEEAEKKFQKYKRERTLEIDEILLKLNNSQQELDDVKLQMSTLETKLHQKESLINQQQQVISQQNEELENFQLNTTNQNQQQSHNLIKRIREQHENQMNDLQNKLTLSEQQIQKQQQEIQKLKVQIPEYERQLQVKIFTQNDIDLKENEINKEHQNYLDARDEIVKLNKTIQNQKKQQERIEQEKDNIFSQLQERKLELISSENRNKVLDFTIKQKEQEIVSLKEIQQVLLEKVKEIDYAKSRTQSSMKNMNQDIENMLKKQAEQERKIRSEIELRNQQQADAERNIKAKKLHEDQIRKNNEEIERKRLGVSKANQNVMDALKTHGQLDVCFLVDVTGSMESYKEQTKNSIKTSLQIVRQACNRETNWAAICYQDISEWNKYGQKYHEYSFSKDSTDLENWLDTIKCSGGGDAAEDVRGAIKQMCKLNWPNRFKIAILICDAPTHGSKYNGGCGDDHKDEDIRDAILEMISKNIIFIGLNFRQITTTMYKEIEKIYVEKQRQDLFLFADLTNLKIEQAAAQMSKYIGQASQNATQTNKSQTKSKNQDQPVERPKVKDGAMEALCNKGNFYNFEEQADVKTVEVTFKVLKIEIKETSFENNLENIKNLRVPEDYSVSEEGIWKCFRTEKPFAFGMMKDVFLMKKMNKQQDELYVIKTPIGSEPYTTKNAAIQECRSHLVCQRLMKKFQHSLEEGLHKNKVEKRYPNVIYSDFLILEESPTKYWIAERFFKGDFIKYNNNYGYINDEITDLNKIAQAFSFYTYYISGFSYMVSDVQGVGIYFTDPAVNTTEGNFDDTDMGEDGMKMYLVNYQLKKDLLAKEILEILGLYE